MNKGEETVKIETEARRDALVWVVVVRESVTEGKMGRDGKCLFPRGHLEEESGERGTNESEGIER